MTFLAAPDPRWPALAEAEIDRWHAAGLTGLQAIHHIGATAIRGLPARPVIDLMPVFADMEALAHAHHRIEELGYAWAAERRAYRDDPETGAHAFCARCQVEGAAAIDRHLAWRDALRNNAPLCAAYTAERARCAGLHPDGGPGYERCKAEWTDIAETKALEHRK